MCSRSSIYSIATEVVTIQDKASVVQNTEDSEEDEENQQIYNYAGGRRYNLARISNIHSTCTNRCIGFNRKLNRHVECTLQWRSRILYCNQLDPQLIFERSLTVDQRSLSHRWYLLLSLSTNNNKNMYQLSH